MLNSTAQYLAYAPHFSSPLPLSALPWYHVDRLDLLPGMSDKVLSLVAPVVAYWAFSLFWTLVDNLNWDCFEKHRIHEPEEITSKNRVTVREVLIAVFVQHALQTIAGYYWLVGDEEAADHAGDLNRWGLRLAKVVVGVAGSKTGGQLLAQYGEQATRLVYFYALPFLRLTWAMMVMDGWQYIIHRSAHQFTWLYRNIHSWHHRLYVPYAFGALYNHPLEGLFLDTIGTGLAHELSGLTTRQAVLFFVMSTLKTVDDHCGFALPYDPFQHLFGNNADYHDIHHQVAGLKKNYSQPWFISWDIFFNTRMTRDEFSKKVNKRFQQGEVVASEVNGPNELAAPPTSERNGMALKEKVN